MSVIQPAISDSGCVIVSRRMLLSRSVPYQSHEGIAVRLLLLASFALAALGILRSELLRHPCVVIHCIRLQVIAGNVHLQDRTFFVVCLHIPMDINNVLAR